MLLLLLGCLPSTISSFPTCDVDLVSVSPAAATVGEAVTLTATPLTEDWDTAIRVGGIEAPVLGVEREGCSACDSCRSTEACSCTEDCDTCDALCAEECVETVTFTVPDLTPGEYDIVLFNAHGGSAPLSLVVVDGDTGTD